MATIDDLARDEALRALLQTPEAGDVYDAAYNRVHEALQLVPEVVTWAIVGRQSGDLDGTWRDSMVGHDARAVYRIHGAMLEPDAPTAAVTRIPLAEIVEVAVTTATRKDDYHGAVRTARWTFRTRQGAELEIVVEPAARPQPSEKLARSLAAAVGWDGLV